MKAQRSVTLFLACIFFLIGLWLSTKVFKELDAWALTARVDADVAVLQQNFGDANTQATGMTGTVYAAERAVLRTPLDADRVMQAGLVWTYAGHMAKGSLDRRRAFKEAITYYELARELRPAWPHHYRNLHELYFLTQRSVIDRNEMLLQTYKYGKWNRVLKLFVLEHSLARPWDRNDEIAVIEEKISRYLMSRNDSDSRETVSVLKARYPAFSGSEAVVGFSN